MAMVRPSQKLEELRSNMLGTEFESRKNKVFRTTDQGGTVVVKEFSDSEAASKEFSILTRCSARSLPVPRPLSIHTRAIIMECLPGGTVAEALDSVWLNERPISADEEATLRNIADGLGEWLASYHALFEFGLTRGDAIMKNFLVSGNRIVGIDFEEASEEDVIRDLGEMCSSIISMHPMFTVDKFAFCRRLSERYFVLTGAERDADLSTATAKALRHYASFRIDGGELAARAAVIESDGLFS
ncbi:MAG TPA: phosphotransferase [Thermoplasmata archaeon]|nr:phosphotransferase [Thermoplasmata archaeon]